VTDSIDWDALASHGHAPVAGCSLLGVGYEDAYQTLMRHYVDQRFASGLSAEKLVVGPFGSGKTHFLRQMMEMSAQAGAVTSEVKLNKDIDFTKRLVLYKEIAEEIRAPNQSVHGMGGLIQAMAENVRSKVPAQAADAGLEAWTNGITSADLKLDAFSRVTQRAFESLRSGDDVMFESAVRWLAGDISDRQLAKVLPISAVGPAEQNRCASQMLLSLFQLVRHAGYLGTVVCLDEAEQGLAVDRKHMDRILSMLKSDVDAISDLEGGSALDLYAVTPDIRESMDRLPALQQRFADPGGVGFFSGNYLAAVIDLTFRSDPAEHLVKMARRLVEVFAVQRLLPDGVDLPSAIETAERMATEVAARDQSSSSRRELVKTVCAYLLGIPSVMVSDREPEY
jgi:hypothetical protein